MGNELEFSRGIFEAAQGSGGTAHRPLIAKF